MSGEFQTVVPQIEEEMEGPTRNLGLFIFSPNGQEVTGDGTCRAISINGKWYLQTHSLWRSSDM